MPESGLFLEIFHHNMHGKGNLQGSQQLRRRGGRLHKFINCTRRRRSFHALSTSEHFKYVKLITFTKIFCILSAGVSECLGLIRDLPGEGLDSG